MLLTIQKILSNKWVKIAIVTIVLIAAVMLITSCGCSPASSAKSSVPATPSAI